MPNLFFLWLFIDINKKFSRIFTIIYSDFSHSGESGLFINNEVSSDLIKSRSILISVYRLEILNI